MRMRVFPWSFAIAVVVVVVFPGMVMRMRMGSVRTVFCWGPARRGRWRRGVGIVGGIMFVL